ncbi:hypothetical protein [Teichococcus vastitatis]|uniref:Uncharacterized protein n=1 Tax=Teichococcus vastitatis TaxID=2307076 RepID=A0ABS9WAR1_9PROT|nr:hypothetical protein [Pseudoroseomonas vastitatis]MCI0756391.1 hypothetical protein [Pseudoroseomonas vastitatis]
MRDLHAKKAAEPMQDMLVWRGAEARTIELKAMSDKGYSFTVEHPTHR